MDDDKISDDDMRQDDGKLHRYNRSVLGLKEWWKLIGELVDRAHHHRIYWFD